MDMTVEVGGYGHMHFYRPRSSSSSSFQCRVLATQPHSLLIPSTSINFNQSNQSNQSNQHLLAVHALTLAHVCFSLDSNSTDILCLGDGEYIPGIGYLPTE
jgi:hypothetical protein